MARRRMTKVKFNQNLILEVVGASLLVQKAPGLLNQFVFSSNPLTGMTATMAGVGAAWLLASFMNKPNIANAAIALGGVELIGPVIDNIIGVGSPMTSLPVNAAGAPLTKVPDVTAAIADFVTLDEYVGTPGNALPYDRYKGTY